MFSTKDSLKASPKVMCSNNMSHFLLCVPSSPSIHVHIAHCYLNVLYRMEEMTALEVKGLQLRTPPENTSTTYCHWEESSSLDMFSNETFSTLICVCSYVGKCTSEDPCVYMYVHKYTHLFLSSINILYVRAVNNSWPCVFCLLIVSYQCYV